MSSKKDQLGRGASFDSAASARSARATAIDRTINGGGAANIAAITDLPVPLIGDNPDNPRNHLRNLDEIVETVREVGVLLPVVVATVDAYLRDRPERADDLDDGAQYLIVDGHRRLEAARRVGLASIPVRVDNARVSTDEALLEAAFIANYHRDDMTDLEEAHALKQLVDYYGSQTKAAKRLGMSQGTISSKLSLLKLTPELQKDLMTGARTVEHVRNLGKLRPEEQRAKADERAEASRRKADVGPASVVERSSGGADYHGVISHETVTADGVAAPPPQAARVQPPNLREVQPAAPAETALTAPVVPSQAAAPAAKEPLEERQLKKFPYNNGLEAAQHLMHKMPLEEFGQMLPLLNEYWDKQMKDRS